MYIKNRIIRKIKDFIWPFPYLYIISKKWIWTYKEMKKDAEWRELPMRTLIFMVLEEWLLRGPGQLRHNKKADNNHVIHIAERFHRA